MASVMAVVDIHNINAKPSRQSEARTTPATACLCRLIKPHLNARCKTSTAACSATACRRERRGC
jgi:hypothetical protein